MNELALIAWVCSALRAAVSHWWQLCFALASLMDSRQWRECAVAACVRTRRGSHSPALKKDGHGREGLAEVARGGCGWGQHAIPAFSLVTPYAHPPHIQDSCTQGSCSLHCCTRGLAMSPLVAADAFGIKIFRRERSQGPVGKQRRSAAVWVYIWKGAEQRAQLKPLICRLYRLLFEWDQ